MLAVRVGCNLVVTTFAVKKSSHLLYYCASISILRDDSCLGYLQDQRCDHKVELVREEQHGRHLWNEQDTSCDREALISTSSR